MSEQPTKITDAEILQMLTAEHTNLQAVRSGTSVESTGRTNLFLGTVSSAVIALAFIGQVAGMKTEFTLFALILLPALLFIGLVTFLRVHQSGLEDMLAARGINRIRHYYTEAAPHMKKYFILSANDDMSGVLWNMGIEGSPWQLLVSAAGLVSVMNSLLAAVFVGMLTATIFNATPLLCLVAGAIIFAVCLFASTQYQQMRFQAVDKKLDVLFPSEKNN